MEIPKNLVARLTLKVPLQRYDGTGPVGPVIGHEVAVTARPGWSKYGANELALPGGKIEQIDLDKAFQHFPEKEILSTPDEELLIAAAMIAVLREIEEELQPDMILREQDLHFVGISENNGYTTYSFVMQLSRKPELRVKPDSGGTLWLSEADLMRSKIPLFADHGKMVEESLQLLNKRAESLTSA